MFRSIAFAIVLVSAFVMAPCAYAGKVELTTYYPVPNGDYKDLQTSGSLKVPVKAVAGNTTKVAAGEVWVEQ